MKCDDVLPLLAPLADGELDDAAGTAVVEHARGCVACGRELDEIRSLGALLRTSVTDQLEQIDLSRLWPEVERRLPSRRAQWWRGLREWSAEAFAPRRFVFPAMAAAAVAALAYMIALNAQPSAQPGAKQFAAVDFGSAAEFANPVEQLQSPYDSVAVFHDPSTRSTLVWVGDTGPASEAFE